jgi:hypothetical protein
MTLRLLLPQEYVSNKMAFVKRPSPDCFQRQLKDILKKFPNSKNSIEKSIDALAQNPLSAGDRIQGLFTDIHIRKIRLPIEEYNISQRKGLRVILLVLEEQQETLTITIYYKGNYKSEDEVRKLIKKNLKEILATPCNSSQ